MHPSTYGRIERRELRSVSVEQLALLCAAVGHELSVRAFPAGDPVRDAGHLRLLERFRSKLPPGMHWQTEVPLPLAGDLRASDAVIRHENLRINVEAETRLGDIQAMDRRLHLKKRDSFADRLILVISDTRPNRDVLRLHREALRGSTRSTRGRCSALSRSEMPSADGIVLI